MAAKVLEKAPQNHDGLLCQHYWVLERPTGEMSTGVCKHCGARRGFPNGSQGFVGEEERSANLTYWGAGDMSKLVEEKVELYSR